MYAYRLRRPVARIPVRRPVSGRYAWSMIGSNPAHAGLTTLIIGGPNPRRYDDNSITFYEPLDVRRYTMAEIVLYDNREVRRYTQGEVRLYGD